MEKLFLPNSRTSEIQSLTKKVSTTLRSAIEGFSATIATFTMLPFLSHSALQLLTKPESSLQDTYRHRKTETEKR